MKHLTVLLVAPVLALGLSGAAHADERPDHFEGERAATLDEALAHLSTYNAQLQAILAKDELGPEDDGLIEELMQAETYLCFGPDTLAEARNRGYKLYAKQRAAADA